MTALTASLAPSLFTDESCFKSLHDKAHIALFVVGPRNLSDKTDRQDLTMCAISRPLRTDFPVLDHMGHQKAHDDSATGTKTTSPRHPRCRGSKFPSI
jgi:hypothetical protein